MFCSERMVLSGHRNGTLRETYIQAGRKLCLFRGSQMEWQPAWAGVERETTERGWSAGGECLCPDRLRLGKARRSFAAEMTGNLDPRLAVAFRLRMRRPGARMDK